MAMQITDEMFESLLAEGKPLVLDFWAEWCGPCKMVTPLIDLLASEYEGRPITIGKVDVDKNSEVSGRFGVRNIPTVLFFKNGELVGKLVGAHPKAKYVEEIEKLLQE